MKKRIISLFLVVAVLCTALMFAGCNDEKKTTSSEPDEKSVAAVLKEAVNKNEDLDAMSAVMKMEMNIESEGMTMSVPVTANIKAKNLKSDNMISLVDMTMSLLGEEVAMQMYQEGEWAYVVMDDFGYKYNLEDELGGMDYADSAKNMLAEIPEDLLLGVEPVKAEDGSQTVTISIPGEKFSEIYNELIEDVAAESGALMGETNISDAVVTITIADGYVTVYDISFTMNMTEEGISTAVEAKVTLTFDNPGQDVEITPPEGYQDFEEMNITESLF